MPDHQEATGSSDTTSAPATRVITYAIKPGKEPEFKAWQESVNQKASKFTGYLGVDILPPAASESGDEWVVIYRYNSPEALKAWLESTERAQVLGAAPDIFVSKTAYTVSGTKAPDPAMTIVTAHRIIPGKEAEYEAANKALNDSAARFPGFAGCEIFEPTAENDQSTVLIRFNNKENMDRWLSSPERAAGREALYKLTESHHTNVVGTGFGSWFAFNAEAGVSAAAWKQAMVVLSVLFPVVMTLNLTVGNLMDKAGVPFPFIVFTGNLLGTCVLTWLAMPVVSRLMDWWLAPRCLSQRTVLGLFLLFAIYAVELTIFKIIS